MLNSVHLPYLSGAHTLYLLNGIHFCYLASLPVVYFPYMVLTLLVWNSLYLPFTYLSWHALLSSVALNFISWYLLYLPYLHYLPVALSPYLHGLPVAVFYLITRHTHFLGSLILSNTRLVLNYLSHSIIWCSRFLLYLLYLYISAKYR